MAWHPRAVRRPLPGQTPTMTPTAGVQHSDAGYVRSLYGWWTNPASKGLSCHTHVSWEGEFEQYISTDRKAFANMAANDFALSCEASNSPDYRDGRVSFDDDPFSPAQIRVLIDWWSWALQTHPTIAPRVCTDGRNGLGWHEQFAQWTTPGHHCPGRRRVEQLQTVIFPAVFGGPTEEDLDMTADELRVIVSQEVAKVLRSEGVSGVAGQVAEVLRSEGVSGVADRMAQLTAEVGKLTAR